MSPAKFEWMPYRSSGIAPPHGSHGRRDIVTRNELLLFAHCLRACELVGVNSIEQYRPHRVARQLGYDQDVPGAVARVNSSQFAAWATYKIGVVKFSFAVPIYAPAVTDEYEQWWEPCSRACATAVAEAARMKVSILTQIAGDDVNGMKPGWVRNAAKRATSRKRKKCSQGPSAAVEPIASVAEKERPKSLQKQSQEDASQPVTIPNEQNTISEQAQVMMTHHPAKQTQFGATASSLLKPCEERQPASTGNSGQGNIVFRKGEKFSQGSSGAVAILMAAVDEPSASVAEKERSKYLQQQSQEDASQPVATPDEQNSISKQAQVPMAHHPAKQTQFGATTSSLLKPSEERQPASTGNSDQGNIVFRKGEKFSQGSSGAAAILMAAVDEPSASVAEKERSESLQQKSQEDASQPVATPDEQNSISKQAQVLMAHHPANQTQFGATTSSLLKPSEERRPVSTGNNEPAATALEDLTLQQEPADGVAAVRTNADLLPAGPTEETRTRAVTVEMGNGEMSSSDPVSEVDRVQRYCATALAAALKNITLQQEPADPRAVTVEMGNGEMSSSNPILEHLHRISELDAALKNITLQQETNNNVSSSNQRMECAEANENSSGNGENMAPDSTEVCTKTLYYLSRSDRSEEAWANDANRNADFFQPKRAVGTMEMIAKASAIRQAEIAALEKTIMELMEEIQATEAAEEQERRNRKK